jgi:hypothetical protein
MHFKTSSVKQNISCTVSGMRLVVPLMLALCACKHDQAPALQDNDPGDVIVQAPGLEPRRPLRYTLAKGAKSTIDFTIDTNLTADAMGGAMPTLALALELTVEEVLADGAMKLRTTVVDATARDRADARAGAQAAANVLAQMKGLAVVATLSPIGKVSDAHLDAGAYKLPDALTAQLAALTRSFDQLAMPLPREPVGPTAKWTSTRQLDVQGMAVRSTSTIELVSITGTQLGFAMKTVLLGPDQQVTREGVAIDVTNLHGTGSGEGTVDLGKLATTAKFESNFHSDMLAAGDKTAIDMSMKIELAPAAKP